ncbi:MAG: helix-turn-helix domain-containing protein [Verrucomicrobia bacterium]|nr:helix-turn-helix domain-containing protein [Verrucomicrobiota bacterium]MBU1735421.1 helix-turn-helix domain-containing protein [Verrucomicrobiota bacterium]MBU1857424.1 helix-turn-helix domain-containing protein [Verrucomicrobiota bacterium]
MKTDLKHITPVINLPAPIPVLTPLAEQGLDLVSAIATPPLPRTFPRPMKRTTTWIYSLALGGCCYMQQPGKMLMLKRGDMLVINPDCLRGYTLPKGKRFYRIYWTWRFPPLIPFIKPEKEQYLLIKVPEKAIGRLQYLHATCRKIFHCIDQFTPFKLHNIRMEIELLLAQNHIAPDQTGTPAVQFDLAQRWMEEHIAMRDAVGVLCNYLAISPATLNRLFHQRLKISPQAYFQNLKMKCAQTWLQSGISVKAAAYQLGYKHPNNFSFAYKRHMGAVPSERVKAIRK